MLRSCNHNDFVFACFNSLVTDCGEQIQSFTRILHTQYVKQNDSSTDRIFYQHKHKHLSSEQQNPSPGTIDMKIEHFNRWIHSVAHIFINNSRHKTFS